MVELKWNVLRILQVTHVNRIRGLLNIVCAYIND